VRSAEGTILADEDHVYLGQCAVEWTIVDAKDVVGNEAALLHEMDNVIELWPSDHGAEKSDFDDYGLGLLERACSACEDLELRALYVDFDEIRAQEFPFGALLVDGHDGHCTGSSVNGGAFDFSKKAGADLVGMDVESSGALRLAGGVGCLGRRR